MSIQGRVRSFLHSLHSLHHHYQEALTKIWKQCIHSAGAAKFVFNQIAKAHANEEESATDGHKLIDYLQTLPHKVHSLHPESLEWNMSQKIDCSYADLEAKRVP